MLGNGRSDRCEIPRMRCRDNYFPSPLSCEHNCVWPNLGSAALASRIGKSGRTRKPMITTKCVGAVTLTEIRGALHGAQIPETLSNWANQATSDPGSHRQLIANVGSSVIEFAFDTLEHVDQGPAALLRSPRHRHAVRRRAPQPG